MPRSDPEDDHAPYTTATLMEMQHSLPFSCMSAVERAYLRRDGLDPYDVWAERFLNVLERHKRAVIVSRGLGCLKESREHELEVERMQLM